MIQMKYCLGNVMRISMGVTILSIVFLTVAANAAVPESGNRIWDSTKNMNTTYTWNSYSFSGFYYNLDDNFSTEELTISNIKPSIDEGDIIYKTSSTGVDFDYSAFGKYQVIGFMGGKYFAGYTENSLVSGNKKMSTLGKKQLHRLLLDHDNKRTVNVGETLTLEEGYVLKISEIDIGSGPGKVWVVLSKNGIEVDNSVVEGNKNYVYSKDVGNVDDLPIIAVHFDSVFRGIETNAVFIKGIFQVSDTCIEINPDDRYGSMEIKEVKEDQIIMENQRDIQLSKGNTIDLMGDVKIIVADNNALRFALSSEGMSTYEVRGTVYPITDEWTPLNFGLNFGGGTSAGFYYDLDEGIGTEKLTINQISGTSIPDGQLLYSTSAQVINFDYSAFGTYQVIGFMAGKYFAGYTEKSSISGNKKLSNLDKGQLHQVLLDNEDKHTVYMGGTLPLREGYVLKMNEIDISGAGRVMVSLEKNGVEVDSDIVTGGGTYVYSKDIGRVDDFPIIAVHFDTVFRGMEVNAAFIKGIFQVSELVMLVKTNDRYGEMEISRIDANGIQMKNEDSIRLSSGSTVDLTDNIMFKVADSSDLRFYPFIIVSSEAVANQLVIQTSAQATAGDEIKITVTSGGKAVGGASISIDPEIGLIDEITDTKGNLVYVLPRTLKGTYNITATKLGYERASKSMVISEFIENKLNIDAPVETNQLETIIIVVTHNGTGVSGVAVTYDNMTIGQTDNSGTLTYTPQASGIHTISASKSGYNSAVRDIRVRIQSAEFKSLDIKVTPDAVFKGNNAMITSNITNIGTSSLTLPVVLIINDTEVGKQEINLAPREVKEVAFTYKATLPAGNYSIKILEQESFLEIKEKETKGIPHLNIFLILGILIIALYARKSRV